MAGPDYLRLADYPTGTAAYPGTDDGQEHKVRMDNQSRSFGRPFETLEESPKGMKTDGSMVIERR
jgi:hypothetical protein